MFANKASLRSTYDLDFLEQPFHLKLTLINVVLHQLQTRFLVAQPRLLGFDFLDAIPIHFAIPKRSLRLSLIGCGPASSAALLIDVCGCVVRAHHHRPMRRVTSSQHPGSSASAFSCCSWNWTKYQAPTAPIANKKTAKQTTHKCLDHGVSPLWDVSGRQRCKATSSNVCCSSRDTRS